MCELLAVSTSQPTQLTFSLGIMLQVWTAAFDGGASRRYARGRTRRAAIHAMATHNTDRKVMAATVRIS